jgi:hypothetical protein
MNEHDENEFRALLARDAAALRAQAPASSPLLLWHRGRQQAAQRFERRLRWIAFAALLLLTAALTPMLLRSPLTAWWLLPVIAGLSPLWRSLRR